MKEINYRKIEEMPITIEVMNMISALPGIIYRNATGNFGKIDGSCKNTEYRSF